MTEPLVTVILRSYERPVYLRRAIQSVLTQTYGNIELIITDDCSQNPEVQRIMLSYANIDKRVTNIFHFINHGFVCKGTNDAIKIAKGEFICFLDDDNHYCKDKIFKLVIKQQENNYDLVYSLSYISDLECKNYSIHRFGKGDKFSYEQMKKQNFIDSMEYIIRKSIFDDVGMFKEDLSTSEDWDFLLRACRKYKNIGFVDEPLNYYSQHKDRRMFHTMDIDKANVARIFRELEELERQDK